MVLSFTPVQGASSYRIQVVDSAGQTERIEGVAVEDYSVQGLKNGIPYRFRVAAVGPQGVTDLSNELTAAPTAEMDWESLAEAFRGSNPTRTSCPFWMVHGNETEAELREFMQVIHRFGFEGVTLHPYDYNGFLEENNWKSWRTIVDAARKMGLTVWEQDDKDYPCGYAGGKVVAKDRKLGRWEITLAHQEDHHGPGQVSLDVQNLLPSAQHLVAVVAVGPQDDFRDLTELASDGHLLWQAPEGEWKVFLHGAWQPGLNDPKGYPDLVHGELRGYIDYLSQEATDLYVQLVLEGTCRAIGSEHVGKTWKGFYIDEPGFYSSGVILGQPGGFPYTPDFFARFHARFGYSIRPLLPLLWLEQGAKTNSVRHDYMEFVSTGYDKLFLGKQTRFAEARGMQIDGHVREDLPYQLGGGTGSDFRMLESYSMGGFDHIFDQWYTPEDDVYWRQPKMASSVSHYMGTPLDEAMVEHFAATGWRTGLTEMKAMMDWTTCRGLSRIVPCGLDTKDPPVWEDQPEFWLHGRNPLAPYFLEYQKVANRETMLIRGGRHVARALVLDTAQSAWVGPAEELWRSAKAFSQAHVDYDLISYGAFGDPVRCRLEGARFRIAQEEYEIVALPAADAVPQPVMARLAEFFRAGGTVILVGPGMRITFDPQIKTTKLAPRLPTRSADGRHDEEVRQLADAVWGPNAHGAGEAFRASYKDLGDLLYGLNLHDVWIDPNLSMLQYYHRRLSGRDVYFFNNEGADVTTAVRLRDTRGVPELWDPVTGSIRQAPVYSARGEELSVRLNLARYESTFVVVNPEVHPQGHLLDTNADEVIRDDRGRLMLRRFSPGPFRYTVVQSEGAPREAERGGGSEPLAPVGLRDGWLRTEGAGNGARYQCHFGWQERPQVGAVLEIQNMNQVILVRLNGRELGMRFAYPFRFDLTAAIRPGDNQMEIQHVERFGFTSRLGEVRLVPYYSVVV